MTAALASDQRAEQLESLRRKMAVLSERQSGKSVARSDDLLSESEAGLAVPPWLAEVLPAPLPRGTVAVLSGARSLLLGMVAAVTAAGGNAAIVGQPVSFTGSGSDQHDSIANYGWDFGGTPDGKIAFRRARFAGSEKAPAG